MCNDTETGFYYLQSRYYDPALGRFINGDSYASTGQGYLGYNMFAYCNNNPVMSYDPTGHSNEAYYEWMYGAGGGSAMAGVGLVAAGVALTSGGGRSLIDTVCSGVKKCATALAYAAKKLATTAADIVSPKPAAVPATKSVAIAQEKVQEKNKRNQAYFPEDPNLFFPAGLIRNDYSTKRNGTIIKWSVPGSPKTVVFEWDEDIGHVPHYHVLSPITNILHEGSHYHAGDPVPEPWNTIYFVINIGE